MNSIRWTEFALEAEYKAFGMVRIAKYYNRLRSDYNKLLFELEELKRREFICCECGLRKNTEHEHEGSNMCP
jgi:hypothetical protein